VAAEGEPAVVELPLAVARPQRRLVKPSDEAQVGRAIRMVHLCAHDRRLAKVQRSARTSHLKPFRSACVGLQTGGQLVVVSELCTSRDLPGAFRFDLWSKSGRAIVNAFDAGPPTLMPISGRLDTLGYISGVKQSDVHVGFLEGFYRRSELATVIDMETVLEP
jgi:hypothetical protein